MKKLLMTTLLAAATLVSGNAQAHPWMCVPAAGSALPVTAAFMGGFAAFALAPVAIVELQDYHVWNQVFPVVDETFPATSRIPLLLRRATAASVQPITRTSAVSIRSAATVCKRLMFDRYLICAAYAKAGEMFHSGQFSKGYAKLCQAHRIGYREGLGNVWKEKGSEERNTLAALLWKRRHEIKREW